MSVARATFIERASVLRMLADSVDIVPGLPAEIEKNERARHLRCAIALSSYMLLEEFIRERTRECLAALSGAVTPFVNYPPQLRDALTVGVLRSLGYQLRPGLAKQIADPIAFVQEHSRRINSTTGAVVDPSKYAFGPTSSNISWGDIDSTISAFGVEKSASNMSAVAVRIAGGIFVPKDYFEICLERRNRIAHVPWGDVAPLDVRNQVEDLWRFCCSFDVLLSFALKKLVVGDHGVAKGILIKSKDVKLRFVDQLNATLWREVPEGKTRAKSRHSTQEDCINAARASAMANLECVVARFAGATIAKWEIIYI